MNAYEAICYLPHRVQVADHAAQAVVEWRGAADPRVSLIVAKTESDHVGVVHDVVVGERRALGAACRARCELDVGRIIPKQ